MALNPLKRIINSALNRDPIQEIFSGSPTPDTYLKVMTNYSMLPHNMRQDTIRRCLNKLIKPKQPQQIIACLALVQKLMKINFIFLPNQQLQVIESSKKKQIFIAEKSLINFYFLFLKFLQKQSSHTDQSIQDKIIFCQIGLEKCLSIIKNNIFIDYCLMNSQNQVTLRIALKQIFQDCRNDLQASKNFIEAHAKMIYQSYSQVSFSINQIYQKLIFVSKNIHKISVLIKKAGLSINLPVYQIDKDLNMKIEMEMNVRRDQKTKFKTEKLIKSKKSIELHQYHQENSHNNKNPAKQRIIQSLSEIDENDILIQSEELL